MDNNPDCLIKVKFDIYEELELSADDIGVSIDTLVDRLIREDLDRLEKEKLCTTNMTQN